MLQASSSPSFPVPVMICLPGLSHVLTPSQFLLHAHASIASKRARGLNVFAQGGCSLTGWRHLTGAPAVRPSICVTAARSLSSSSKGT
jgi:hypothetical protein